MLCDLCLAGQDPRICRAPQALCWLLALGAWAILGSSSVRFRLWKPATLCAPADLPQGCQARLLVRGHRGGLVDGPQAAAHVQVLLMMPAHVLQALDN